MTTRELIQKFKDLNKIIENDKVVGMIAYGSRVNNYDTELSDLDIMLITNSKNSYVGHQSIEGISVDINIVSLNIIGYLIEYDAVHNDRYYSSVFNTGSVEKNVDGIIDYLKDEINSRFNGRLEKRKIRHESLVELANFYWNFIDYGDDSIYEDYYYYNLLELIRQNYNYVHNCSRLNFTKVYDLFVNNRSMRVYYQLKLPKQDFMDTYLGSLNAKNKQKRKEVVDKLMSFINVTYSDLDRDEAFIPKELEDNEIQNDTVYLRNRIKKVEEMILSDHFAKDFVYYIVLYRLKNLLMQIDRKEVLEMEEEFNKAISAKTDDDRIKSLEAVFAHIDKKFNIDYDNYLIKKY